MANILIVDDSPTDADKVKTILEKEGYQTSAAISGEEGIQKAQEVKPDVVLMDVVMPGLNGFQATRKITKNPETKSIPVIIVSSKNMESDKAWAKMQGATDFLVKPVSKDDLLNAIKKVL
ncbi:response regulator [Candidatus Halobeggiatoa sp. HSG11]|nr:response regulator [Candidatus Halobeggiatoa sp. HSG11]